MAKKLRFKKGKPAIKPSHEGDYHAHTGVPEGQTIPQSTINKDLKSRDPHVRQMANFANNARKWHHKGARKK